MGVFSKFGVDGSAAIDLIEDDGNMELLDEEEEEEQDNEGTASLAEGSEGSSEYEDVEELERSLVDLGDRKPMSPKTGGRRKSGDKTETIMGIGGVEQIGMGFGF